MLPYSPNRSKILDSKRRGEDKENHQAVDIVIRSLAMYKNPSFLCMRSHTMYGNSGHEKHAMFEKPCMVMGSQSVFEKPGHV